MNYLDMNRDSWNQRTAYHLTSQFYDVKGFLAGKNSLQKPELDLLGDVNGKTILHLQCHFGQDSLSLARMGAQVVGVDLADKAIDAARDLNEQLGLSAEFIQCDLFSLPQHLDRQFDIVFTSYGTIGWLPDIAQWAGIVNRYLKPGGRFVFAEFHPVLWMLDNDLDKIVYRYFHSDPIVEQEEGTYTDRSAEIHGTTMSWNHGLAEVIQALIHEKLVLRRFDEYDYSPYDCFSHTVEVGERMWRIKHLDDKIPMMYTLLMEKGG
ncbi:MAG: class I SAM-dependent methyltransferase [Bacteroidia bacterium]|nr:class I SAM-dependent methyltransferase [Bacteroidia bacterium]